MKTLSHTAFRESRRFRALDGLRAVVVLTLIAHHFQAGRLQPLIGIGKITVFFVLSGFVITLLLLRDEEKNGDVGLKKFYIRRQFRLLPLYYVILLAYVVCRMGIEGEWDLLKEALPYYLLLGNELAPPTAITAFWHSWTMGYEFKFYLIWPLLFVALSRYAPRLRSTLTLTTAAACLAIMPLTGGGSVHYFALLLGCAIAFLLYDAHTYRFLQPLTHPTATIAVPIGFLALHIWLLPLTEWTSILPALPDNDITEYRLAVYALGVVALVVSLLNSGPMHWILTRKPLLYVGERSYSIYLIHGLAGAAVLGMGPALGPTALRWIVICFVAVAMGDFLHRCVELPSVEVGRRLIARITKKKPIPDPTPTQRSHSTPQQLSPPKLPV